MSNFLYVYAILPSTSPAAEVLGAGAIQGIDDRVLTSVQAGGLVAAVSDVSPAEFEDGPLNELVRSMDWLAPRAARHQAVNATLFELTEAIIPLTFGTVYRTPERVCHMLECEHQLLNLCLERVRGKGEWVLSLYRTEQEALGTLERESAALLDLRRQIAAGAPGRAYLLARRLDTLRWQELLAQDGRALTALETLFPAVDNVFTETVPAGAENGLLARLSALVSRQRESALTVAADGYQSSWSERGYDLRVTGPWPPYRFGNTGAELLSARR